MAGAEFSNRGSDLPPVATHFVGAVASRVCSPEDSSRSLAAIEIPQSDVDLFAW